MYLGKDDSENHRTRPNSLLDGEDEIILNNSTFLPSLELVQISETNETNAIFGSDGIVLEELLSYFEPVI
jgi:hypothetical protein